MGILAEFRPATTTTCIPYLDGEGRPECSEHAWLEVRTFLSCFLILNLCPGSQAVASSSSASFIHTSAVLHAKSQKLTQKAKTEIKQQRYLKAVADRPSPVLGLRPEDEHKWQTCDLAKVLVNEKELESPPDMVTVQEPIGEVELPKQMAFGVTQAETETLFRDLPYVSATASAQGETDTERMKLIVADGVKRELQKAKNFAKVLDLRNADADGIAFENRRRIILAFSPPENPFDPGCSEVQGVFPVLSLTSVC